MSEFTVHSVPGSPFGRAVLAMFAAKGADFHFANLLPVMKTEAHLALHPFGRIPALSHGDFTLYETQAILRYLDRVLPSPSFTPGDAKAMARMDQLLNISDWYLMHGVNDVIGFQRIVGPIMFGLQPDEAKIAEALPKAHVVFAELSKQLGAGPYFAQAQSPSLADIMIACHLDFLAQTPEWAELTEGRGNLVEWLARMNAQPFMQATTWEKVSALAA
jgi:glutathione S-transferase